MSIPTYADLVRRFGLAFRPDLPAYAYADHPRAYRDPPDREAHDAVVRAAFAEYEAGMSFAQDPYGAALAIWQQAGLLGSGDPGPPAFRAAHAAYLLLRADAKIDTSDIPEATKSDFARARLSYPRPRIPLQEMLDAVARFSSDTHPLRINTRTQGTFAEMERVFGIHRDVLVAWFAEHGVDVDPEA